MKEETVEAPCSDQRNDDGDEDDGDGHVWRGLDRAHGA